MLSDVFIRRPILATVCSLIIILAGAIAIPTLPIARYPELDAAVGHRHRVLHRRQRAGGRERGDDAARAGHQRRRGDDLHHLVEHQQRRVDDHGDVRHRPRPRPGRGRRAEPRQPGARPHAGRGAHQRHHRHQEHGRVPRRARVLLEGQPLQHGVHQQLPRPLRPRRAQARARRRQRASSSASASSRCGCGSIRRSWRRAASRPATWRPRCASRTCRWRPAPSATRRPTSTRCIRSASARPAG